MANDRPSYERILLDDKPREACGIFGICGHTEAAAVTYFGLYALQHRGQESAGIAVARDEAIYAHRGMGLVPDVFDVNHLEELEGCCAIGHVRYSTTGSSILTNAQPFIVRHRKKTYAVGHNGNITNAHVLKEELEQAGSLRPVGRPQPALACRMRLRWRLALMLWRRPFTRRNGKR